MEKIEKDKKSSGTSALRICMVILGNILYAFTVKFFLLPCDLATGGVTGIALALNHLTGLNISLTVLIFNLIMLLLGFLLLGKSFALTTILSTFAYPIALAALDALFPSAVITDDMLLCTIFSGLGIGLSVGIVIRAGSSTGGMDIPPLILNKYFRFPVSVCMYIFDFCILLLQLPFTDVNRILYGIVLVLIYTIVIDRLMTVGTSHTEVKIVSPKVPEIRDAILHQLDRGVTLLDGRGGYLNMPLEVIFSVISNRELPKLEKIVQAIDPTAFIVVSRVSEVGGRGFSLKKDYK